MLTLKDLPKYEALLTLAQRYPELNITSVETCLTFLRTATDVYGVLDVHFDQYDLSMGKFTLLMLLVHAEKEWLTPSECAERAGVTRGTVTGLLDGLEREGWIQRCPCPEDRRRLYVSLTTAGEQRLDQILPRHFALIAQMLSELTTAEMKLLQSLLQKLRRGAQKLPQAAELEP
ncbi:MAG: MarR family transcriptional regulator [Leptolyngbya sp. SIO4C5]|uniref:MarR family transcriptional regulator n=1 Tax=Sphaerothrix gracilis TaxID=3151835 RepID=UPI0013BF8E3A|nr:MarR family transcriptional regulator [Leptolyngbya sp. SIO4C5]